jgi:hypothetical protein
MKKEICQSCGMPMDKKDFGSNSDGTPSIEYCHFCFKQGKFSDEGITMQKKILKNIEIAKKMGMSEEKAISLAQDTIPKLKRWQNNP